MRAIWAIATLDLVVWLRSRWAVAASLLPPLGMAVLVGLLTVSVGQQPVALVVEGKGELAMRLAGLYRADEDAYLLSVLDRQTAERALRDQQVAAVILIPSDFDQRARSGDGRVILELNNVDIDVADDIRRATARSVGELDAPQLGLWSSSSTRSCRSSSWSSSASERSTAPCWPHASASVAPPACWSWRRPRAEPWWRGSCWAPSSRPAWSWHRC